MASPPGAAEPTGRRGRGGAGKRAAGSGAAAGGAGTAAGDASADRTRGPAPGGAPGGDAGGAAPGPTAAQDWLALWQSELAALALDREAAEALGRLPVDDAAGAAPGGVAAPAPAGPAGVGPGTGHAEPAGARGEAGRAALPVPPGALPGALPGGCGPEGEARTDAPGPMRRRGPRPLALHLALSSARPGEPPGAGAGGGPAVGFGPVPGLGLGLGFGPFPGSIPAAGFGSGLGFSGGPGSGPSLGAGAGHGADRALLAGIAAYRRHPYRRELPDPPVLWEEGGTRLLDYGACPEALPPLPGVARRTSSRAAALPPVLVVPSLVNRAYVLDLRPGHSLLRWLAAQGVRPLLLDWGWPGAAERTLGLDGYVARLLRAQEAVGRMVGPAAGGTGGRLAGRARGRPAGAGAAERGASREGSAAGPAAPLTLLGYCMGGLLCVAAAQLRPELVGALALLATPWDFHAPDPARGRGLAALLPGLEPTLAAAGALPVDALQAILGVAEHAAVAARYRGFAAADQAGERAQDFVALEDWLADGVPLAAPVARECLGDWYGGNAPALGSWRVGGVAVRPELLRLPSFVAVPSHDRVVPAESALPLAERLAGSVLHRPGGGHVGMVAGGAAEAALWRPLLDWLRRK